MDADDWDERYRGREFVWSTEPNQFLPPAVEQLAAGRALDLACGEGRNAVWLATQGWEVTGVDFSAVGIDKGRELAAANDVDVHWVVADATRWESDTAFDLVILFYLQLAEIERRAAVTAAARALAPGGTIVVVAHDSANLTDGVGGPQDATVLYTPADVVGDLDSAGIDDLTITVADRVTRAVATPDGTRQAIDCRVTATRR